MYMCNEDFYLSVCKSVRLLIGLTREICQTVLSDARACFTFYKPHFL